MENEAYTAQDQYAQRLAALCRRPRSRNHSYSLLSDFSNRTQNPQLWSASSIKYASGDSEQVDGLHEALPIRERPINRPRPRQVSSGVLETNCTASADVSLYFDGPNDEGSGIEPEQPNEQPSPFDRSDTWLEPASSLSLTAHPKCISPNDVLRSSINFRLRPSQRPAVLASKPGRFRAADRFTPPRRPAGVSRETFLFSRTTPLQQRARLARRRGDGLTDPLAPPTPRYANTNFRAWSVQDQNSRQVSSARAATVLTIQLDADNSNNRRASGTSIWRVGGLVSTSREIRTRQAPRPSLYQQPRHQIYISKFLRSSTREDDSEMHRKRLALALDIDQSQGVLASPGGLSVVPVRSVPISPDSVHSTLQLSRVSWENARKPIWRDNEWMREDRVARAIEIFHNTAEQTFLEAPHLRDDFYCSMLAYSHRLERLAVALGCNVYLWSEFTGVINTPSALNAFQDRAAYVTSVTFSSEAGGRAILAVGRADGRMILWSALDEEPRYLKAKSSKAAAHLSFRPVCVRRPSQRHASLMAENEVLLVGDDSGVVSIYFVEWPEATKRFLFGWHGSICLHARISVHTQQVCGISWSPSGEYFATGGNDNLCCLFQTSVVLAGDNRNLAPVMEIQRDVRGDPHLSLVSTEDCEVIIRQEKVRHQWRLNAAIKAIAFCPWQRGLLAAGGGSNDRCVHFFHTMSGASLAAIDCAAQVTSLIWSETRREIAVTFGFAQPDHPYRVAVYSWPSCQQLVAIPWANEMRALHAIGYPGRSGGGRGQREDSNLGFRTAEEGCIVVAGSDGSIKFHEIWSERGNATAPRRGLLGGSDILESLHGIEKDGKETIR